MIRELSHQARDGLRVVRKAVRQQVIKTQSRDGVLPILLLPAIDALREVPARKRAALLRKLFSARLQNAPPSTAERCEFESLGEYSNRYAELATLLGHPPAAPPPGEL